jgi:hypothetical protein
MYSSVPTSCPVFVRPLAEEMFFVNPKSHK